jgi:surface polysaccharide O-acyltransferase-like enzyme
MMRREANFEVMRTLAMFFIVVYHCLTHGMGRSPVFTITDSASAANFVFSDFLLVFASISVNLYVMVSGYFLCNATFKVSRIVRTWLNACFYSCIIASVLMALSLVPWSFTTLGKSLFPLSTDAYWFVTQYIGLLILAPFLAILVRQLSYRQYIALLVGGAFLCLSVIPDFPLGKRYSVTHGNSVWYFAYLFMIAGFIRHHLKPVSDGRLWAAILIVALLMLGGEIGLGMQGPSVHLYWFNYNASPFVLSVLVFVYIRQCRISATGIWKLLARAAPYTFGVYLIHDHLLVRAWLWKSLSLTRFVHDWGYPFLILGLCLLIFVLCAMIDVVRKKLFDVVRVDKAIAKFDRWTTLS